LTSLTFDLHHITYAVNNPLIFIDPTGLIWGIVFGKDSFTVSWYVDDAALRAASATPLADIFPDLVIPLDDLHQMRFYPKGPHQRGLLGKLARMWAPWAAFEDTVGTDRFLYGAEIEPTAYGHKVGYTENRPQDIIAAVGVVQVFVSGMKALSSGALARAGSSNSARGLITLFRGVPKGHEMFDDALKGIARPLGGHSDPALHNMMNTQSEFTSWTTQRSVATKFAGEGGVVLQKTFTPSQLVRSPDAWGEAEVLVRGTVTGAKVTK